MRLAAALVGMVLLLVLNRSVVLGDPVGAASDAETDLVSGWSLPEAIRVTLEKQATIQETKVDVAIQKARLQQARGAFDQVLSVALTDTIVRNPFTRLEQLAYRTGHSITENYVLDIGLSRQNRSGVKFIPSLQVSGTRVSPNASSRSPELLGQGGMHFTVIAPLGRGRKADLNAANEKSSQLGVDAALNDVRQEVTKAVYQTIAAYWNLVAAEGNLEVQELAEKRGQIRVQNLNKLVAADQIASADVVQAEADLADTQAALLQTRQAVTDARLALGLAMGITREESLALGSATTSWGDWSTPPMTTEDVETLIQTGLAQRQDLAALKVRKSSMGVLLPALRSMTRPRLDLSLDVGYNGLTEGGAIVRPVEALVKGTAGFNTTAKLSYEFPLENRAAVGNLRQQQEGVNRLQLQIDDLVRTIALNIHSAYRTVTQQYLVVQKLAETIDRFQTAYDNEEKKQKIGLSTILDTLNVEDRLITAKIRRFEAQKNLALALSRLQFECGGLSFSLGSEGTMSLERLFQEPLTPGRAPADEVQPGEGN